MRASVSLKIFLGFMVVVVSFGAVSVWSIVRTQQVQEDVRRLNKVYLPLNDVYRALDNRVSQLITLHRNFQDLIKTALGTGSRAHINRYLPLAKRYRDERLVDIRRTVARGLELQPPPSDRRHLEQFLQSVTDLARAFQAEDALYDAAFDAPPPKPAPGVAAAPDRATPKQQQLVRALAKSRRQLSTLSADLRRLLTRNLGTHVRQTAQRLEDTESRTMIFGTGLTLVACVVAVAMMLLAGYTLRPLRVLREGAQVIGRGNYAHRVKIAAADEIGDLAREFNAMAGAIEEREARLIESERIAARSERLATVGRLAAQVTHEVRNPLSAIQLNTEMLDEEIQAIAPAAGGEARALLSAIQKEVDRLTEVTEAYLQFARLPRPRLELEDLAAVIQGTTSFVEAELATSGVALAVEVDPDLPRLQLDENQIRQALLNLLRNAREAMPDGGTVTVSAHRLPGGGVELVVGDSGCGMAPEQLQKVFDPFFTTKEKGTGLGLTVTSQIIGEHGGTIQAESQPNHGTRFVIRLPSPPPGVV